MSFIGPDTAAPLDTVVEPEIDWAVSLESKLFIIKTLQRQRQANHLFRYLAEIASTKLHL